MANKELWTEYDGKGFYAQLAKYANRAINDEDGNSITATYAGKSVATDSADGLMSSPDKSKLDGIAAGADVNVIEGISVNGTAAVPDANKTVSLVVPAVPDPSDVNQMPFSSDGAAWSIATWETVTVDVPEDTVTIDGHRYPVVKIGSQAWIAENLAMPVGTLNTDYRTVTEDGVELYFYRALSIISASETMSEMFSSKLPSGWRIPTVGDFTALASAVNNNSDSLKSTLTFAESTLGWTPHQNTHPTNATGFNLMSIYGYNSGSITFTGKSARLLSSTKSGNWYFIPCAFGYSSTSFDMSLATTGDIATAYPVRLVRDI